jgi:hypothetical protein
MRYFRPLSVLIPAFVLFLVLIWFTLAGVDYDGTQPIPSFTTAGWFILGSPCIVLLSVGFAKVVVALSGKRYWYFGQVLMAAAVVMTGLVIWLKLPANLVSSIIGSDLAEGVAIHRLRVLDSFNDGSSISGVISGREGLLESIVDRKSLKLVPSVMPRQVKMTLGEPVPDANTVIRPDMAYVDKRCEFYRDPDNGRIYFRSKL